jgi:hypothetical protein
MQFFLEGQIVPGGTSDEKWSYGAPVDMPPFEARIGKPTS